MCVKDSLELSVGLPSLVRDLTAFFNLISFWSYLMASSYALRVASIAEILLFKYLTSPTKSSSCVGGLI